MELEEIKQHWEQWSKQFTTNLRATTKTSTIKKLEINALHRAIKKYANHPLDILEVGCGNGFNCFSLSKLLENSQFTGVDYVAEMIENAKQLQNQTFPDTSSRISFFEGNILNLQAHEKLKEGYDIVFTDRCIINLNTTDLQLKALDQLSSKVKPGGHLLILENFIPNYAKQNACRESVGLEKRNPAEFNYFIDTDRFLEHMQKSLKLVHIDDFGSLHDIILYVLTPMINQGAVDYDHPLVNAATDLSLAISDQFENPFGSFGQNRLFVFQNG